MDYFGKALWWTLAIGFGMIGIWAGLVVLKVAIGVVGYLLGSTIGSFLLVMILIGVYKKYLDKE